MMLRRPSRRMRVAAVAGMPSKVQVRCTFRGLRRVKHLCLRLFSVGASREQAEWPEGRKACSRPYVAEHLQPHDSLASDSSGPVAAAPLTSERRARCAACLLLTSSPFSVARESTERARPRRKEASSPMSSRASVSRLHARPQMRRFLGRKHLCQRSLLNLLGSGCRPGCS